MARKWTCATLIQMMCKIDRNSSDSLQKQLYLALKEWFIKDFTAEDLLPTEKAIAKESGLSQGTVRIALDKLVREDIILRVPGRGTQLNRDYKIKLKKYHIGVILSEVDFFDNNIWEYAWINHLEIINGIVDSNISYNISTEFISEDYLEEECKKDCDGFILWPFVKKDVIDTLQKPWIQLDYRIDMKQGFKLLAEDVVLREHRNVGYIGFTSGDRVKVINEVFRNAGLQILNSDCIYECGGSEAEAYRACMELLREKPDLDCLICSTDVRARGAIKYIKERQWDIPGKIAIYGFDGTRNNTRISPSLTTCRFDWKAPGRFVVSQIRNRLDGDRLSSYTPIKGQMVLLNSTRH